jgi:PhzF family phenazine biosynthesis protein
MTHPLFQVDAFASGPFTGNPAAVCLLSRGETPEADWMQAVAAEMNLAETAFVRPRPDGDFDLRWFTPAAEVKLCGHATLASAHVLWTAGVLAPGSPARFRTLSGVLTATQDDGLITLDFPSTPTRPVDPPEGLFGALGLSETTVESDGEDVLIELDTAAAVRDLQPDLGRLSRIDARGIIITARSDRPDADIVSRFFAPRVGVPEDPVTGSAHCRLAAYWASRLGKTTLRAVQASPRGGHLLVELDGDRVRLSGQAVTVLRGELLV